MTNGYVTLNVGEEILVYNLQGEARIEKGPQRLFLWRSSYTYLTRHRADQNQYLRVCFKDGRAEHLPGPCILYENPLIHASVRVCTAEALDANDVLVVYSAAKEPGGPALRTLVRGPTLFIPQPDQWMHDFDWHGTSPDNKTKIVAHAQKFTKLKTAPNQLYYNIDEVRTSDDGLIRVKVMLFYEITDIERMLEETQDPIADLINALCADVVIFASKMTYTDFLERCQELNQLQSYSQLQAAAKRVGYAVSKVAFRGYLAHPKLQQMHDSAISDRTQLQMKFESEQQQQHLLDVQLQSDMQRMEQEQTLATERLKHASELKLEALKHELQLADAEHRAQQQRCKEQRLAQIEASKRKREQEIKHLSELQNLGVDVSEYLLAQHIRPDKFISLESSQKPTIHFHNNS